MCGPDAYARESADSKLIHTGADDLRAFYNSQFSNGGGIALDPCAVLDDARTCALEYNVVRWGGTELAPQAGFSVYRRSEGGKLAAVRIYADAEPPAGAAS